MLLPEAVILDAAQLATLPPYERGATLLDALCHSVESYWSARAQRREVRGFAAQAIRLLVANAEAYLAGDAQAANAVLMGGENLQDVQSTLPPPQRRMRCAIN